MDKIKLKVNAKINLSLNILGRKGDLHELDTVMASVDIADVITVCKRNDNKINIDFSSSLVPKDNTVLRAINLINTQIKTPLAADIFVEKNIPLMGGLGGSSADAAAVLFAFDKIFDLSLRGVNVPLTALKVGSDVPYMLQGGYMRVGNTGERLKKLDCKQHFFCVILMDNFGVSTAACYKKFDELFSSFCCCASDNDAIERHLALGEQRLAASNFGNALMPAATALVPSIGENLALLKAHGAYSQFMSGSGSACVGLFQSYEQAENVASKLEKMGFYAKAVQTLPQGIQIIKAE